MASVNATNAARTRFPVLFISHGGPPLALDKSDPLHQFLREGLFKSGRLPSRSPKAIVCFSAHWETTSPVVQVTSSSKPETIHDFYGFEDALYELRYPAPGDPLLANRIVELINKEGGGKFEAKANPNRGLDHGTWIPLYLMYPPSVPVIQVSILHSVDPALHLAVGRALAPLARDEDVLVIGSGSLTHNLGEFRRSSPTQHASDFHDWVHSTLTNLKGQEREKTLSDFKTLQRDWRKVHPTDEHFVPLFYALGAASAVFPSGFEAHRVFDHWYGSLNCAAYVFDE